MRTLSTVKQNWSQVGRWAAAACLLVLAIAWGSPALAATPAWWDCNYGYRKQITVTTGTSAVPNGYSVSLTFDHASLVSAGKSLASGNDVRVLYWTGAAWVELDRVLDSSWNNSATKIWFNLQAAISASSSDNNYYLYYGNPAAGSPPGSGSSSLIFTDGFESNNLNAWTTSNAGSGDSIGTSSVQAYPGGTYSLRAEIDTVDTGGPQATVWKDFTEQTTLYAKINIFLPTTFSLPPNPDRPYVVVMQFIHDTGSWTNLISATINEDMTLYMWNDVAGEAYGFQATPTISKNAWHTLEMVATISPTAGEARLWLDSTLVITATGKNLGSNLITRFATGHYWSHPRPTNYANTHYTDNVALTLWQNPALTTSLGTELANDCPPPGPSLCNWQYKRKLTFNNAAQAENLIDFPVLVKLNSSRINYGQTQDAGQDLRFTDSDGVTLLAHEIEKWDEAGTSYVWVKVPQIDASSTTDHIWMYYGNATAPDGQNKTAVWDGNFKMVHHLKETTGPHRDSTSNAKDSTAVSVATQGSASGQINGADAFTGASGHNIDVADASNAFGMSSTDSITVEAWVKTSSSGSYQFVVNKKTGTSDWQLHVNDTGKPDFWLYDGTNQARAYGATTVNNNAWHYLVARWTDSSSEARIFIDGASSASGTNASFSGVSNTSALVIGEEGDANRGYGFTGTIDEVRYSKTARSNAWISAQYKSMTDTFITPWGSEQSSATSVGYFTPDAFAAGMSVPVTFVGSVCQVPATFTTSSSDIVIGPSIVTDANGAVVTSNGSTLSTVFFIKPNARPTTGVTVTIDGKLLTQTFDIVIPAPDPNGVTPLSGRTKRGTKVLAGLTVPSGTLTINTSDTDNPGTAGNQGYLPAVILVKGDVNITGTLDVKGANGAAGGVGTGGTGGNGGPGGGGGAGGGVKATGTAAAGGHGFSGGGGGASKTSGNGGAGGDGTGAFGSAFSGQTGGAGGVALGGATGGGAGQVDTQVAAGDGGGGGTGDPLGTGGIGGLDNGSPGGKGGGGGGAAGGTPGGGGGGGFAAAGGSLNGAEGDAGLGGAVSGTAHLVPLAGGSGGAGGGPDTDIASLTRGGGGGGGGGAVLIYATGSITVSGTITAVGGNGGNGYTTGGTGGAGGGGSGGAIFMQSGTVTASGTLTTAAGTGGTSAGSNAAGGAGGTGRIRIDGLATAGTVPGTAGSKFIGPAIDTIVDRTVKGRAEGGSTVTLYVYDSTGAQVSGSPYTTTATGASGAARVWTIPNVTFPSGTGYLAVKQSTSSGTVQVFGPGRSTKGVHLTNWREVY